MNDESWIQILLIAIGLILSAQAQSTNVIFTIVNEYGNETDLNAFLALRSFSLNNRMTYGYTLSKWNITLVAGDQFPLATGIATTSFRDFEISINSTFSTTGVTARLVIAQDYKFNPRELVVQVGDYVRWIWAGGPEYNVAQSTDVTSLVWDGKGFRSGSATEEGSFVNQFEVPGTYFYVCENHASAGMIGWVIVTQQDYTSGQSYSKNPNDNHAASSNPSKILFTVILIACTFFNKWNNICLLALFLFWVEGAEYTIPSRGTTFSDCAILQEKNPIFNIYWRYDDSTIYFGIESSSVGYVSIGFGSDIYVAFNQSDDCVNGCIFDYISKNFLIPSLDDQQDATLLGFLQTNNMTYVEFSRPLNSSDLLDDENIDPNTTQSIMWAVHTSIAPINNTAFVKHNFQGMKSLLFSKPSRCPATRPYSFINVTLSVEPSLFDQDVFISTVAKKLAISHENIVITRQTTVSTIISPFCPTCERLTYAISNFTVPKERIKRICIGVEYPFDSDYQIFRFEPLITSSYALAIIFYQTQNPESSDPQECDPMISSATPIYGWSPGQEPFTFPNNVYYGVGGLSGNNYGILQIMYHNPGEAEAIDNSGISFVISTTERTISAGFLTLGVPESLINIPSNSTWLQSAFCPGGTWLFAICILQSDNISSSKGVEIWTERIRNGSIVSYLGKNNDFDYFSPSLNSISGFITRGDRMATRCVWSTIESTGVVGGTFVCSFVTLKGDSLPSQEMCMNVLLYYPLLSTSTCRFSATSGCVFNVTSQNCAT